MVWMAWTQHAVVLWFFSWACSLFFIDLTLSIFFIDKPSLFYFPSRTVIMIRSPFPLLKKAHVLKTWRPVGHGVMKHEKIDLTNGFPHHYWEVGPGWRKQVPGKVCLVPRSLLHGVLCIYLQRGDPLGPLHALTSYPKATELSDHRLEPLKFWAQISLPLCCSPVFVTVVYAWWTRLNSVAFKLGQPWFSSL